jgi:TRAP-type uncharacterized transport system substrate-binding protein
MGTTLQGWNGTGAWTHGKELRSMRAMFPMYDTPFQFIAPESSGIRTLPDMADKRIGVGPQGGTGGSYASRIFEALGIPATVVPIVSEGGQPASAQSECDDQPITKIGHMAAQIRIRMHPPP